MHYLLIGLLIAATTHAGDIALEAIHDGLIGEMAATACSEGDQTACILANQSTYDPEKVASLMIEVVQTSQATCASHPSGKDCDILQDLDRQAEEVLAKHGQHRS